MNFPDPQTQSFKGIQFSLSSLFTPFNNRDFVRTDDALTFAVESLTLFFSVEAFDQTSAERIRYLHESEIDLLDAVHAYYVSERENSLQQFSTSLRKKTPKTIAYPGYIQVVHELDEYNLSSTSYFIATVSIDDSFFVFQLIGKKENMGYLYDDFLRILETIKT